MTNYDKDSAMDIRERNESLEIAGWSKDIETGLWVHPRQNGLHNTLAAEHTTERWIAS